jgi:O-antigen ligase
LAAMLLQSVLMLAQISGAIGDLDFYGIKARAEFAGDSRVSGTLGSPNPAAAYLGMMMVLCYGALFARLRRVDRYLVRISLALAAAPLVFTLSRGGWMLFITGVMAVSLGAWRRVRVRKVAWFALVVLMFALVFRGAIVDRLYGDDNGSAAARMPLNRLAAVMIEDHPIMGFGANNFALAMQPYVPLGFRGDFLYTVHNKYLLVWAEDGLAGLIAFIWLLLAILVAGWRCWKLGDPVLSPLALGCAAAVAGLMVQMNFDPLREGAESHLVWLFAGLIVAMTRLSLTQARGRS